MQHLKGRVAIITGAAGGIGTAAAKRFLADGAKVVLVDRDEQGLQKLVRWRDPRRVELCAADVTQAADTKRYIAAAVKRFGGVDILLANAGIEGEVAKITAYPEEVFDRVMAVNVRGVWLGLKHVIPAMKKRGGGSIVITASTAGIKGAPNMSAYITSKHAVVGMMRSIALECAPLGIRVNSVHPCPTETGMIHRIEKAFFPRDPKKGRERMLATTPSHRYATAEEVAAMMAFLAGDEASFCTGGVYTVDGGRSAT
ncbi:MAG: SDR family oxidoreductase [Betaproteobacteria bacterium]|nr:SDR family oxidoreductase [Betaproteobacteria bacterium]